jgi:hypothetical protein
VDRRSFLKRSAAGAAGLALAGCDNRLLSLLNKGDEQLWGMNVHPAGGALQDAQIEALKNLGIRQVRMTLGLHQDLAGPYLRRYPAEYLGLLSDFQDPRPDPRAWPDLVRAAVRRSPGVRYFEVLNEPSSWIGAQGYVESYLKPAYDAIKALDPGLNVVAAAPSTTSGGRFYFYQMTDAGADSWCDFRGAHLYSDNPEIYVVGTRRPFMVTESGVEDPGQHIDWWAKKMTHISGVLRTDRLYFYVLADIPDTPYAIISSSSGPGNVKVLSPLYDYIRSKGGG